MTPRRWAAVAAVPGVLLLVLLGLAAFPWGVLKGRVEQRLSRRLEAPVRIARAERIEALSFHPTIRLTGIAVGQPAWAGPGALATVREARVRINVWAALFGGRAVEHIVADGATFYLVRDAGGRANWEGRRRRGGGDGDGGLSGLEVRAARVRLRDAKRGMTLDARLDAGTAGFAVSGAGTHRGRPMRLAVRGATVAPGPWPFRVTLSSPLLDLRATGTAERALDLGAFSARVMATASDARRLDDVIEAGLPGTQPVKLDADVRHRGQAWDITRLTGRIGRSPLTAALTVRRLDGRTALGGRVDFAALDFDDLATDAQLAEAAARQRAIGPRVIPATQIHFEKLGELDTDVRVTARRLLFRRPSLFRSFDARLRLDRRLLAVRPLSVNLAHGRLTGSAVVDHRGGDPKLTLDLRLARGRLEDLLGGEMVQAPLSAHVALAGSGRTVREALARADGRVGLAALDGTVEKSLAVFGGGDLVRGIGTLIDGGKERVPLRCVAARFVGRGGRLAASPLLVDTAYSGADGRGTITLDGERIDLSLSGQSKRPGLIQSTVPIRIGGTLSAPDLTLIPLRAQNKGLLGKVGAFVAGLRTRDDPKVAVAGDRDCAALAASVLR